MDRSPAPTALDPDLRAVLDLEHAWRSLGVPSKDRAIRGRLGISPARYHQLLNRALDLPEAVEHDPMLVLRLRRLRDARRRARALHPLGPGASPG